MTDDIVFGTDSLRDSAAKLTKIYLKVKGGTLTNEEYRHTGIYCSLPDVDIIDFFTRHEGNKRLSTVALLCAGFSRIQNTLNDFPVLLYDISQVFARISLIDDIDYMIMEETVFDVFVHKKQQTATKVVGLYIPEELWGMLYNISLTLKIKFSSFVLYLLRTGIVEYNTFVSRFSNKHVDIPYEYIHTAEKWKKVFEESIAVKYNDLLSRVKYLYNTYSDILDNGHEDLKEEMKKIIDKST